MPQDPTGLGHLLPHWLPPEAADALPCPAPPGASAADSQGVGPGRGSVSSGGGLGWRTLIWLPAAPRLQQQGGDGAAAGPHGDPAQGQGQGGRSWSQVARELVAEAVSPSLLLFLRRVRAVVVEDALQGARHVLTRHDGQDGSIKVRGRAGQGGVWEGGRLAAGSGVGSGVRLPAPHPCAVDGGGGPCLSSLSWKER